MLDAGTRKVSSTDDEYHYHTWLLLALLAVPEVWRRQRSKNILVMLSWVKLSDGAMKRERSSSESGISLGKF